MIEAAGLATNLQVLPDLHTSVAVIRYPLHQENPKKTY